MISDCWRILKLSMYIYCLTVSDYMYLMLKCRLRRACNVNYRGPLRGEGGGLRVGESVNHQPGTRVDEHSHHEIKRGISK
jgi:hypothetical protein